MAMDYESMESTRGDLMCFAAIICYVLRVLARKKKRRGVVAKSGWRGGGGGGGVCVCSWP